MHSCLYHGQVRHRRFEPVSNEFQYPIAYLYFDLEELDQLVASLPLMSHRRRSIASICREDHLGDARTTLRDAVLEQLAIQLETVPHVGPIRLLTLWRSWGTYFSPVNFYYCYDVDDRELVALVAEVSNTPWNERHVYVLGESHRQANRHLAFENEKVFHVSPFLEIGLQYRWRLNAPGSTLSLQLEVCREHHCQLDATITLQRRELTGKNWLLTLAQFPWLPARVLPKIYWQALRLWIKKVPFYPHPQHRPTAPLPIDRSTVSTDPASPATCLKD